MFASDRTPRDSLDESARARLYTNSVRPQLYAEVDDDPVISLNQTLCIVSEDEAELRQQASSLQPFASFAPSLQPFEPKEPLDAATAANVQATVGSPAEGVAKFVAPSAAGTAAAEGHEYAVRSGSPPPAKVVFLNPTFGRDHTPDRTARPQSIIVDEDGTFHPSSEPATALPEVAI